MEKTKEPQYQTCLDHRDKCGATQLGLMAGYAWHHDPRHLLFTLSRYKFVAKMLSGRRRVLEVGCADAFASRLVQQEIGALTAVDFDEVFVRDVQERMRDPWKFDCRVHDFVEAPVPEEFDGFYSLDVLEHIPREKEHRFLSNAVASLSHEGAAIIGTPSRESQVHASAASREGHVNCKDAKGLRECLEPFFSNVCIFSMNDEVVHTGYAPMAQYLMALCFGPRR